MPRFRVKITVAQYYLFDIEAKDEASIDNDGLFDRISDMADCDASDIEIDSIELIDEAAEAERVKRLRPTTPPRSENE